MVDPPTPIVSVRTAEVVPVSVLDFVGMKPAKAVDPAPGGGLLKSLASLGVKVGVGYATVGMIDVDGFRGNV